MEGGLGADGISRRVLDDDAGRSSAGDNGGSKVLVDRTAGTRRNVAWDVRSGNGCPAIFVIGVTLLDDESERTVPVDPPAHYRFAAGAFNSIWYRHGRHREDVAG